MAEEPRTAEESKTTEKPETTGENRRYSFAVRLENGTYVIPSHVGGIPSHTTIDGARTDARMHLHEGKQDPDKDLAYLVIDITEIQKRGIVLTFGKGSGRIA